MTRIYLTTTLGQDSVGTLFFSFSHDNDLLRYLTAPGLYDHEEELPLDGVEFRRSFKSSEIVPMADYREVNLL
ncbi:hypothetical protein KL905_003081 [Ogataea polymorpha]|nr:hypothetical protein KL937_003285 [Ogataea polymorpha]KAG7902764.1 hypothetical protein KL907_003897 [Ogataea polymorpha]KAG7920447.1 hypothetical protein KL905_003081 [Ogataea polymorpha]KAG7935131.1 hypothetical protein KL904_003463 [Ogataea polymorpha]KAG7935467.1 hypothetical protein KL934_002026 [Ogataea polymorpha]